MMNVTRTASRYNKVACPELGAPTPIARHGRFAAEGKLAGHASTGRRTKRPARTLVLADVELKRIEDALLDSLLETHVNRDNALDRLLADMEQVEAGERAGLAGEAFVPAAAPFAAPSKRAKIEELLVAAVLDNHPNRNAALDRIFADLSADDEAAIYDMSIDNDFDGMA